MRRSRWSLELTRGAVVSPPVAPQTPRAVPTPYWKPRRPRPQELKVPYVVRPFLRDGHVSALQHLENAGMYREELDIERSRFPVANRGLTIQSDGTLLEREFEYGVPAVTVLFYDRPAAFRDRQVRLFKMGRTRREKTWETAPVGEDAGLPIANLLAFPYCVPSSATRPRKARLDQLHPDYEKQFAAEEETVE